MSCLIVPYQKKYHDQLVEIWYQAVVCTHKFLAGQDLEFYRQMVQNGALEEVEIWVELNEGSEPIGFIGLDGAKIEMLFVDPNYHGKGTGRRLIQHAEKIKGSHLRVDVNEQNGGACTFYNRLGFMRVGRSELDGSGRPYPLLYLEKTR
ncbi:GNAT family N-acetyltransferase [Paenibacillus sp. FSL R5-0527]|uniref:GNAT family N-acetyltransferase n=1 Tax=Paenibacillus TaxID=44249 RepID=UPI000979FCD2|nr:GNAT family N-acetyltransferase [Paenibacillus macerans]MED4955311.1 GNAT family N-acetyltransferase [Paenibacillus macerans]OMG46193.1 GNAT family N-acetyltransferase [Paenibacillus macerans]